MQLTSSDRAPDHRQWLLFAGCATALLVFSVPTLVGLYRRWGSPSVSFADGYALALLAGVLLYRNLRSARPWLPPRPSVLGVLLLTACVLATLIGRSADVAIIDQAVWPIMVAALLASTLGWSSVRRFWAPLLFLYFAIPFWRDFEFVPFAVPSFNEALRILTTNVVSVLVRATGFTAFIEGDLVHLPSGTFEIAEGCSGRGYFTVALQLSVFYGLMWLETARSRLTLITVAVALALASNWIRVYIIVTIGYFTEMQHSIVRDHSTFGWVLFLLLVIGPVGALGVRLERRAAGPSKAEKNSRGFVHSLASPSAVVPARAVALPVAALAALLAGALLQQRLHAARRDVADTQVIELLPVAGWEPKERWVDASRPKFIGPSMESAAYYERSGQRIGVYLARYAAQRQGREAVYYANRPQGEVQNERVVDRSIVTVESRDRAEPFAEWTLEGVGSRRLVWHSRRVAGHSTANDVHAKLYQIIGALAGRSDARVLVLSARCSQDCSSTRQMLIEFAESGTSDLYDGAAPVDTPPQTGHVE